jgi:hypothetical protein
LVGGDADPAIPRLRIDHPLDKAIAEVATKAHLNISVDRRLPVPSAEPGTTMADCQVYFEWENITARQALTAILDNYDLAIAKDPVSSSLKIVMKPRSGAPTAEKGLSTVK